MRLILFLFLMAFSFPIFAQADMIDLQAAESSQIDSPSVSDVANNAVQIITNNPDAKVQIPDTIDPTDTSSLAKWWWFIYGLLMPFGTYVFNRFFPSSKKSELIIKSTSFAILALVVLITWKGYAMMAVIQGVLGFVMQTFMYDKFLNPLGLRSHRKANYLG